jgi:4-aminobutyrate aminotransferase-like enzyme
MSTPEDSVRRIVSEMVAARGADQQTFLAATVAEPLSVARADLLYLWDDHRFELLDFAAVSHPLGHRPDAVLGAVTDHLAHYGLTAPQGQHLLRWPVSYARKLSEAFSGQGDPCRVLFCEGQRDAVLQACRLASPERPIAVLDTGWHDGLPVPHRLITPTAWPEVDWTEFGALLLSTVTAAAHPILGVREMMLLARTAGVPVIIDESVTGFGRTGSLWGQEQVGLIADLTVLGGPVGGGLPLGAVVGLPSFLGAVTESSPHAGHPWACAAGQVTLESLHPGVLEHVLESGNVFAEALDGLVGQFSSRLRGRHGIGLLQGLRFVDPADAARFPVAVRSRGLHVAPAVGSTVVLAPVLVSSTHEVTRGVDLIADLLMSWEDT